MIRESANWYERLTRAEREVLEAYAVHHSYQAVARALGKSEGVVDRQLASARRKMGVASSAEAMFMLARRNHPAIRYEAPIGQPGELSRSRRRGVLLILAIGSVSLSAIVAYSGFGFGAMESTGALRRQSVDSRNSSAREIAASIKVLDNLTDISPEEKALRRVALVAKLSDRLWIDKWGPEEAHDCQDVLPGISTDILSAFDWACEHQPMEAVRIAGNGHRLFKLAGGDLETQWSFMVQKCLRFETTQPDIYYGRLLCGYALTKVFSVEGSPAGRNEGFQAASRAEQIFRSLGNCDSDVANALRHEGMCCAFKDRTRARELYSRALSIYQRLQDQRGVAQTELSTAQVGCDGSTQSYFELAQDTLRAIAACREAGGKESLGQAWDEMKIYVHLDGRPQYRNVLRGCRKEMLAKADFLNREHQGIARILTYEDCIKIDLMVADDVALAEDIEGAFQEHQALNLNRHAVAVVAGFYDALCKKLRRRKSSLRTLTSPQSPGFEEGRGLDARTIGAVVSTLAVP